MQKEDEDYVPDYESSDSCSTSEEEDMENDTGSIKRCKRMQPNEADRKKGKRKNTLEGSHQLSDDDFELTRNLMVHTVENGNDENNCQRK